MKDNAEASASSFLIVWRQQLKILSTFQKCTKFVIRFFRTALLGDFPSLYFSQLNEMKLWFIPYLITGKTSKKGLNKALVNDAQKKPRTAHAERSEPKDDFADSYRIDPKFRAGCLHSQT
jgi:hypothetical protein